MSNDKQPTCDACNRRINKNRHELVLSDALTDQKIGHYHAQPSCQKAAVKYMQQPDVMLMASFIHPDRCGSEQQFCDVGTSEAA